MENLGVNIEWLNIYKNKRVFVTGHTGFKGSWLVSWLTLLGSVVKGYSLKPATQPNHFELLKELSFESVIGDITHPEKIYEEIKSFQPDIVFHFAAQPLVRYSYLNPYETFNANVMGTLNLLESCKKTPGIKAILLVTTDKVYQNTEQIKGYKETDRLGGYDPYSASKACAELLIDSYRNSFYNHKNYKIEHDTLIASVRGGNVIGGGDWAEDRLFPDIYRALETNTPLKIRNLYSVRPWQHVLDCLAGYLILASHLYQGKIKNATAYNFGPLDATISVKEIIELAKQRWKSLSVIIEESNLHETKFLRLNCDKAQKELKWRPILNNEEMLEWTFDWYEQYRSFKRIITLEQIRKYIMRLEKL